MCPGERRRYEVFIERPLNKETKVYYENDVQCLLGL